MAYPDLPCSFHWSVIAFNHFQTPICLFFEEAKRPIVGMCLLDTIDGALMMSLYTSTSMAKDQIAILYYSIVLTVITVVVAMVIGVIQLLSLILNVAKPTGPFWEGVEVAGDHYDIIGAI